MTASKQKAKVDGYLWKGSSISPHDSVVEKAKKSKMEDKSMENAVMESSSKTPTHDEEIGLAEAPSKQEGAVEVALDRYMAKDESVKAAGKQDGVEKPLVIKKEKAEQHMRNSTSETVPLKSSPTKGPESMVDKEIDKVFMDSLEREKEEREQALSEDIYSLIYTAATWSQAFWFAIFVFVMQMTMLWFILYDLVNWSDMYNAIELPPGVPVMVNIAQGLGVILIVFTVAVFGDLTMGLSRLVEGYDDSVLQNHPDAFKIKWFLSGLFQLAAGFTMTVDLFILMMQSTSVIGLCLNFAALHFVQEIDDMSFLLGQKGFLTQAIQNECLHVSSLTIPKGKTSVRRRTRQMFTVVFFVGLFIPYAYLVDRQWKGDFVCSTIYVQFGDAYIPELSYFGGPFEAVSVANHRVDMRPRYLERTKSVQLAYCAREGAWVFSLYNQTDHCNYFVKSSPSDTFDVVSLKDQTWYTDNLETNNTVPMDWVHLECNDCDESSTCPQGAGVCIDNRCVCEPGRMGNNCQFPTPKCGDLDIDERTEPLPLEEGVIFPEKYALLRNKKTNEAVEIHHHPVYESTTPQPGAENRSAYMVFTGRRWAIFAYAKDDFVGDSSTNTFAYALLSGANLADFNLDSLEDLRGVLQEEDGVTSFGNYRPFFYSAAVDYGTPNDKLEPTGLGWYRSSKQYHDDKWQGWIVDESQPLDVKFLCSLCDAKENPCFNGGECDVATRTCECPNYYVGTLCEHPVRCDVSPCQNNGTCSSWHGYCECPAPFYGNLCQFEPSS